MAKLDNTDKMLLVGDVDDTYHPENLADSDLIKAYVALSQFSRIKPSPWLGRIREELLRRGLDLPN